MMMQVSAILAIVAMWVVLGVGVAPCFMGQELSASDMFADMAGVALGVAPIYIARFRQVAQGDVRHARRRKAEDGNDAHVAAPKLEDAERVARDDHPRDCDGFATGALRMRRAPLKGFLKRNALPLV